MTEAERAMAAASNEREKSILMLEKILSEKGGGKDGVRSSSQSSLFSIVAVWRNPDWLCVCCKERTYKMQ